MDLNKLHLGCGLLVHPDWLNVDLVAYHELVMPWDLTEGLPAFADGMFEVVYHAHLLEHLPRSQAEPFTSECFRLLKPGGVLRVVVPDLEDTCRVYLERMEAAERGEPAADLDHEWMVIELIDALVREAPGGAVPQHLLARAPDQMAFLRERMGDAFDELLGYATGSKPPPEARATTQLPPDRAEARRLRRLDRLLSDEERRLLALHRFRMSGELHKWMYDRVSLTALLEAAGFEDVRRCAADESAVADWPGYGFERNEAGGERRPGSLYMEARKPTR